MLKTGASKATGRARMALARRLPVLALALAALTLPLAPNPADADLRLALQASVSTQCAISGIDSRAWTEGMLRVSTQCNAPAYRLRLMSGDSEIDLAEASLLTPGGDVRLRSGDAWINQDRPGQRQLELRVDTPLALTGPISIRLDAL